LRSASDGIEAVEAVREERFDAIVMAAEMPGLSGWDATRLIRGMANGRNAPVILFRRSRTTPLKFGCAKSAPTEF
jgi:CheY-like chemotaxis protein